MTMTSAAARPGPRHLLRRLITALAAVLVATLAVVVIALPVDLMTGFLAPETLLSGLGGYLWLLTPVAAVSGLLGAAVGTASQWLSASTPRAAAMVSGISAAAVPLLATFALLWSPLIAALQVLWIVVIGLAAGWASWHADRRGRPQS